MRPVIAAAGLFVLACAHSPSRKERETAEIHCNLGLEALRGGRVQDALREYDEALRIDEAFAEPHLGRGLVLELAFGKTEEAERDYRRALELRPGYPEAHNDLGQLLAKTGRLDEAIAEFDAALGDMLYREPFVARCNKGQALYRLGRKDEGFAELRACVSQNPLYCAGHRELGRIQLEEGRVKEGLDELGRYARICDKAPDAFFQLGLAYLKAQDADRARAAFEKCESLGADSAVGGECRKRRELLE